MRRREPSRFDVEQPSTRRERTPDSVAVQYAATVPQPAGVVHMLGEQSTSVSDRIQGEWETREIYVAGGRLNPGESLAVARHSAHGFGWGDGGSGAAQLALALLLRAADKASAVAHYQAFKWEVIARLPQADFTLALSTVRDWLASRSAP